jgi:hypothetical protein
MPSEAQPTPGTNSEMASEAIPEGIADSIATFRRDLPTLLEEHAGDWVAYNGDRCLGFGNSKTDLYQQCLDRGIDDDRFIVEFVEPDDPYHEFPTMLEDGS